MPVKRTTQRSSKGTKLYAVRDSKGRFKDIQTYKRAHTADMRSTSKAEAAAKRGKASSAKKSK
jgi:DNA-binding protein HU-beta